MSVVRIIFVILCWMILLCLRFIEMGLVCGYVMFVVVFVCCYCCYGFGILGLVWLCCG